MSRVMEAIAPFLAYIVFAFVIFNILSSSRKNARKKAKTISSDGHVVQANQDLTCETTQGHNHPRMEEEFGRRYIVHEDPEEGYVILNGIKRRLEDCAKL